MGIFEFLFEKSASLCIFLFLNFSDFMILEKYGAPVCIYFGDFYNCQCKVEYKLERFCSGEF